MHRHHLERQRWKQFGTWLRDLRVDQARTQVPSCQRTWGVQVGKQPFQAGLGEVAGADGDVGVEQWAEGVVARPAAGS
jgi:hypothetical protein